MKIYCYIHEKNGRALTSRREICQRLKSGFSSFFKYKFLSDHNFRQ